MAIAKVTVRHTMETINELGQRSGATLADRLRRVRGSLLLAAQAGLAAGLAWAVARVLIGHPRPFFAPIAAVIVLNVSVGQRLRRAIEMVFGVALGILVGDILIYFIGTGGWQIGASVALAILAGVFLGGSATLIGQAASSAVLVATLAPPQTGIYYSRFIDALIGGVIGVLVIALLIRINPLTVIRKAAQPALDGLAHGLRKCADALEAGDGPGAQSGLDEINDADGALAGFRSALADAREMATLAPVRWRSRAPLAQYLDSAPYLEHAIRNARVLGVRSTSAIRDREPMSLGLVNCLRMTADAVDTLGRELPEGVEPVQTRASALDAVAAAGAAYRAGLGFSSDVIVAQVRSIGTDLLLSTGVTDSDAHKAIRKAVGRVPGRRPNVA